MQHPTIRELIRNGVPNPFTHPEGGGKGSAPPPPDYTGAANAQSAASKEIATQQTCANRPTMNTPWGQMAWSQAAGTDPSTGQAVTNWTGDLSLTPEQQQRSTLSRTSSRDARKPQRLCSVRRRAHSRRRWIGTSCPDEPGRRNRRRK